MIHSETIICLDTPYVTLEWNEPDRYAQITWKGFVVGSDYRQTLATMLDLLAEKRVRRMLCDLRSMKVVSAEDQEWAQVHYMPKLAASPLAWCAVIMPQSTLARISLRHISAGAGPSHKHISEYFDDLEKAREWLISKPE